MRFARTLVQAAVGLAAVAVACGGDGDASPSAEGSGGDSAGAGGNEGGTPDGGEPAGGEAQGGDAGGTPSGGQAGAAEAQGGEVQGGDPGSAGDSTAGGSPSEGGSSQGGAVEPGGAAGAGGENGGATMVTLITRAEGTQTNASFVAFQDGDAPWQSSPGGGGVYRFTPSDDRYGVAVVCALSSAPGAEVDVWVLHALSSELSTLYRECSPPIGPAAVQVDVTVSGLHEGQTAMLSFSGQTQFAPAADPERTVLLRPSSQDALAGRDTGTGIDRYIVKRDFLIGASGLLFDFVGEGFPSIPGTAVLTGPGAAEANLQLDLFTERGTQLLAGLESPYGALPAEELVGNEVQRFYASASDMDPDSLLSAELFAKDLSGTIEIALPEVPALPLVFAPRLSPYVGLAIDTPVQGSVQAYTWNASQSAGEYSRYWAESVTRGWLGEGEPLVLDAADLAGLDGWDDAYGFVTGELVSWRLSLAESNRDVGFALFGPNARSDDSLLPDLDGATLTRAAVYGSLLP